MCVYAFMYMCHTITCLEDAGGGGGIALRAHVPPPTHTCTHTHTHTNFNTTRRLVVNTETWPLCHAIGKSFIRRPEKNDHKLFMHNVVYDDLHHYFLCAHYSYQYKTETGYPHIQVQEWDKKHLQRHVKCTYIHKYACITSRWHFCDEHGRAKDLPISKTVTVHGFH